MTKMEIYFQEKRKLETLESLADSLSKSNCDKKGFTVKTCESWYGWYGDSSCGSFGTIAEEAIKAQISREYKTLLAHAIERQKAVVAEKKNEAREEAEQVLKDTE